jgi:cell division protein FtsQ
MPAISTESIRLTLVTNFPSPRISNRADSLLLHELLKVLKSINRSEFWSAQITQVDITEGGKFELVPAVGNNIIRLGRGERVDEKLNNLMVFYRQVISQTGFDKYKILDVQYKDQVIGVRKDENALADSSADKKAAPVRALQMPETGKQTNIQPGQTARRISDPQKTKQSVPVETSVPIERKRPKAVMSSEK